MKIHARLVSFILAALLTIPPEFSSVYAHDEAGNIQQRNMIVRKKLHDGSTDMNVDLLQVAPGKYVVVIKVPARSQTRIQDISLESPSGKKYNGQIKQVPGSDMLRYLDSVSSGQGWFRNLCLRIESVFVTEAHATCGHCGVPAGGGGQRRTTGRDRRGTAGTYAGFGALMGMAMQQEKAWYTVSSFEVEVEPGEWYIVIKYTDRGRDGKIRTGVYIVPKGEEALPLPPAGEGMAGLPIPPIDIGKKALPVPPEGAGEPVPAEGPDEGVVTRPPEEIPPEEPKISRPPEEPLKKPPEELKRPPKEPPRIPTIVVVPVPKKPGEPGKPKGPGVPAEKEEVTRPPEEEEAVCCQLNGSYVVFPITTDYLRPAQTQEAYIEPAIGAYDVFLHDGSFFHEHQDLFVESVGVDFDMAHTYRSNVSTENGGLYGHKWDMSFNKRLVPEGGSPVPGTGMKAEAVSSTAGIKFYNGYGRVDTFTHVITERRHVKNFHKDFRALVSVYRAPAGFFTELERYVVLPGYDVPFSDHPNAEGRTFYVLRYKDGSRDIFSCRGILLYMQDRHENTMTFIYDLPIHPLTQNPILKKVTDTVGREYAFEYTQIDKGNVYTNYKGRLIKGVFPMMRLASVRDFDGRRVEFDYRDGGTVPEMVSVNEKMDGLDAATKFAYEGDHLMKTITLPRESASSGEPVLVNHWQGASVGRQTHGRPGLATTTDREGVTGGDWRIQSGAAAQVTDRNGNTTRLALQRIGDSYVVSRMDEPLESGGWATTVYEHNGDYQVTSITLPEGNLITFEYDGRNEPVTQGDVRDCMDRGYTYENNLSKGNLLRKTLLAGNKKNGLDYAEIAISYTCEGLFNEISMIEGPRAGMVTEFRFDHGWYATPGNNGNPLEERHPRRTLPDGGSLADIVTTYTYNGRGQVTGIIDPEKHPSSFGYDALGYLQKIDTPDGNTGYVRDRRGNTVKFTDELGTVTSYKVNERDLIDREILDEGGFNNTIEHRYDLNRNLVYNETVLRDNFVDRSIFKDVRRVLQKKLGVTYEYNLLNNLAKETHRCGDLERSYAYAYDANENMTRMTMPVAMAGTDPDSYIDMAYGPRNLLQEKTRGGSAGRGITERYEYDANENLTAKITGAGAKRLSFESDGFDRPFRTVTPLGTEITEALNASGQVDTVKIRGANAYGTAVDLVSKKFTYDEFGKTIQADEAIANRLGEKTGTRTAKYVRDREGKVRQAIDAGGYVTKIAYDAHNKSTETDPLGNETVYAYDGAGNVTKVTQNELEAVYTPDRNAGRTARKEKKGSYASANGYDPLSRTIWTSDVAGRKTHYGYDSAGNLRASVYPTGRADVCEYDGFGRPARETAFANFESSGEATVTVSSHDLNDRLTAVTTRVRGADPTTARYEYYSTDLLKKLITDKGDYAYTYDASGNVARETMPNGITVTRKYDADDRLTTVSAQYSDTPRQWGSKEDVFAYDGLGRVVKASRYGGFVENEIEYNSLGLPERETQTIGDKRRVSYTVTYTYNNRGLRESMDPPVLPGLGESPQFRYRYDALGRLALLENMAKENRDELRYDYCGVSRPARRVVDFTEETLYEYDGRRRLTNARVFSAVQRRSAWSANWVLDDANMPRRFVSSSETGPLKTTRTVTYDYSPLYEVASSSEGEVVRDSDKKTTATTSVRRINTFSKGRLDEAYKYCQTYTQLPGTVTGWLREKTIGGSDKELTVMGESESYSYAGDLTESVKFGNFDKLDADITNDNLLLLQMRGSPASSQSNSFTYDNNGNLTSDTRFTYSYDHNDRLSRVFEKWDYTRGWNEEASYYYDYLNRLVYISNGPSDRDDVKAMRANTRILYDGKLPLAEIETGFDAYPVKTNAFYVTHPEGTDVGRMLLRAKPDGGMKAYLPFFDEEGKLVAVTDRLGEAKKATFKFPRIHRMARLEHILVDGSAGGKVELPMTSLTTRWEPSSELEVYLPQGKFVLDQARNLDKQASDLVDEVHARLSEGINQVQRQGLLLMGLELLPLMFASWSALAWNGADVVTSYLMAEASGEEFRAEDALLSFFTFGPFDIGGIEQTAMRSFLRHKGKAAIERVLATKGRQKVVEALEDAFEPGAQELKILSLLKKNVHPKARERAREWLRIKKPMKNRIWVNAMECLADAIEMGNRWAEDFLDDLAARKFRVVFCAPMAAHGHYRFGTNILRVNPFGAMTEMRDFKELVSTMLHEYVHWRGYNEFRAYLEQYKFMLDLMLRRNFKPADFPVMGKYVWKYNHLLMNEGQAAAENFVKVKVMRAFKEKIRAAPFMKAWYASSQFEGRMSLLKNALIQKYGKPAARKIGHYRQTWASLVR